MKTNALLKHQTINQVLVKNHEGKLSSQFIQLFLVQLTETDASDNTVLDSTAQENDASLRSTSETNPNHTSVINLPGLNKSSSSTELCAGPALKPASGSNHHRGVGLSDHVHRERG